MSARPVVLALLAAIVPLEAAGQECRVLDPELQGVYSGRCANGLAEGYGHASGIAEYSGEFKAGRKHGEGAKRWPNGDRYEGSFIEDRKEGTGVYVWGRGPWQGERYEGAYRNDLRHGFGTYRWTTGDVYAGPWEKDAITGIATPMMIARAKFEEESWRAVARVGQLVCRVVPVGIALKDWVRAEVIAVAEDRVGLKIEDAGRQPHFVANVEVRRGDIVWDRPYDWTPCLRK